jgi:hopanoid biosynthesis associated protein HpnK
LSQGLSKGLIVTADDFGLDQAVNEAVEIAHTKGILTCASLMVAGRAVGDAVARARKLPNLKVGLHVVLVEGRPVLPPGVVPDLVGPDGRFRTGMAGAGFDMFFKKHVRRQLMAEVSAQFEAYAATGLPLDHATAHKHFHLHPSIAGAIVTAGKRFGLKAIRVPSEPRAPLRAAEPGARVNPAIVTGPWSHFVRQRFMTGPRVGGILDNLPGGISEIYLHPATRDDFEDAVPGYRYADELAGLCSPEVVRAAGNIRRGGFSDFAGAA